MIALAVGAVATILAVLVGVSAGYLGGATDGFLSLVTDVILVLPIFPLIIVIAAYEKNAGLLTLIVVLGVLGWSYGARQLRSQTLSLRRRDFLESARVRGERKSYVILHEILPTMTSLIVATFLGSALYAVLTAAGLQFIGLGDPNSQSWGTMLYWAQNNEALIAGMPLWAIAPGVCIALLGAVLRAPQLRVRRDQQPGAARPQARPCAAAEGRAVARAGAALGTRTRRCSRSRTSPSPTRPTAGPVVAVDHVDLELARGEFLAIVGESGCGKSTLLYAIARLLGSPLPGEIVGGRVLFQGRDLVLLEEKAAPRRPLARSLGRDAERDERAQPGAHRRRADARRLPRPTRTWSKAEIEVRSREVLRLVSIDPVHLHSYPHQLSGGMRQRAMIAMALLFTPDLMIMDEPTSALDVVAQRSLMVQIKELQEELGFAVIFVTHDMSLVSHFSDRLLVMYAGQVAELSKTSELFDRPLHPYSQGLLGGVPLAPRARRCGCSAFPARRPNLANPPQGCRFAPRCPRRRAALHRGRGSALARSTEASSAACSRRTAS